MPIENDILALVQESSKDPNGFTPETAAKVVTRLKQFHSEKRAKAEQRKVQHINSPDEDAELADYDSKLNDKEYVNEFLPQLLYEESQRIRTPQAATEARPFPGQPMEKSVSGAMRAAFGGPGFNIGIPSQKEAGQALNGAGRLAKYGAEAGANIAPLATMGPAAAVGFGAIPIGMMLNRWSKGGEPQDIATSLAQFGVGKVVGTGSGALGEWLNKARGLKPGGFNPMELAIMTGGGMANAAVPPMFNDKEGFGGPDENTPERMLYGGLLGSIFGFGKQLFGNSTAGTGTRTLEKLEKQEMIPQGAVDKYGAPSLGSPRIIDALSKKADVQKAVGLNEVLRRGVENEKQLDPGKHSLKTMRETAAAKKANPGAEFDPALTRFAEGGNVSPESVRKGITKALDGIFKPSDALTSMDVAEREAADMGRALIQLHKGDKSVALKSVLGYFAERFYRKPSVGQAEPAEALETLSAVAGGDRLNKLFQGMGFSGKEASQAVATLTKQTAAIDKINQMGKLAGLQPESPITAVRASPTSTGVLANVRDWGRKLNPRTASEAILRGQNQLLSSDQQKVLAGWLRRTEKSPLTDMGGATSAIQTIFSGARDPEKR